MPLPQFALFPGRNSSSSSAQIDQTQIDQSVETALETANLTRPFARISNQANFDITDNNWDTYRNATILYEVTNRQVITRGSITIAAGLAQPNDRLSISNVVGIDELAFITTSPETINGIQEFNILQGEYFEFVYTGNNVWREIPRPFAEMWARINNTTPIPDDKIVPNYNIQTDPLTITNTLWSQYRNGILRTSASSLTLNSDIANNGDRLTIQKIGDNTLTIIIDGSNTIDNEAMFEITSSNSTNPNTHQFIFYQDNWELLIQPQDQDTFNNENQIETADSRVNLNRPLQIRPKLHITGNNQQLTISEHLISTSSQSTNRVLSDIELEEYEDLKTVVTTAAFNRSFAVIDANIPAEGGNVSYFLDNVPSSKINRIAVNLPANQSETQLEVTLWRRVNNTNTDLLFNSLQHTGELLTVSATTNSTAFNLFDSECQLLFLNENAPDYNDTLTVEIRSTSAFRFSGPLALSGNHARYSAVSDNRVFTTNSSTNDTAPHSVTVANRNRWLNKIRRFEGTAEHTLTFTDNALWREGEKITLVNNSTSHSTVILNSSDSLVFANPEANNNKRKEIPANATLTLARQGDAIVDISDANNANTDALESSAVEDFALTTNTDTPVSNDKIVPNYNETDSNTTLTVDNWSGYRNGVLRTSGSSIILHADIAEDGDRLCVHKVGSNTLTISSDDGNVTVNGEAMYEITQPGKYDLIVRGTDWEVLVPQPVSVNIPRSTQLLASMAAAGQSSVTFDLPDGFRSFTIIGEGLNGQQGQSIDLQFGNNGTFVTGSAYQFYRESVFNTSTTPSNNTSFGAIRIVNFEGGALETEIRILGTKTTNSRSAAIVTSIAHLTPSNLMIPTLCRGVISNNTAYSQVRLSMSSGNYSAGNFYLYGDPA